MTRGEEDQQKGDTPRLGISPILRSLGGNQPIVLSLGPITCISFFNLVFNLIYIFLFPDADHLSADFLFFFFHTTQLQSSRM